MKLTEEQFKQIKIIEIELLKAFISVCDILNLKYYILEGTLLGAVRHKGFIPWDDDIDVGMPRKDYERFCEEGQKLLPEYYFIQNIHTEIDYRANFTKLRDSRTTFIETSVRNCDINHGVYIDIFPLDDCLANIDAQKKRFHEQLLMNVRIEMGFYHANLKLTFKGRVARCLALLRYPKIRSALLAREKWMQSLPESGFYANYCSAWYMKEIVPKDWFGEDEYLEFEGIRVKVPKEYDKWLALVYGDYMKLPPEEKRCPHHYVDVIDLKKSYKEYVKQ